MSALLGEYRLVIFNSSMLHRHFDFANLIIIQIIQNSFCEVKWKNILNSITTNYSCNKIKYIPQNITGIISKFDLYLTNPNITLSAVSIYE